MLSGSYASKRVERDHLPGHEPGRGVQLMSHAANNFFYGCGESVYADDLVQFAKNGVLCDIHCELACQRVRPGGDIA